MTTNVGYFQLKAELEAEAAALKAKPEDSTDMMLQYQQQLAKYHPSQRSVYGGAGGGLGSQIQLPTPSPTHKLPIVTQSPVDNITAVNVRRQLAEMSSGEPTPTGESLCSPITTNIGERAEAVISNEWFIEMIFNITNII